MKKVFLALVASILLLTLTLTPTATETAQAKTMWGKIELKKGMIGKVIILKDTYQYSISNKKLKHGAKLKKGKEYGIYSYSKNYGGVYKMGSNKYVKKSSAIKYYKAPRKDITAPLAPTINKVTDTSTSVSGTAEAESKITVKVGTKVIGTGTTLSTGVYSIKIPKQKSGTKLSVIATDSAGNVSKVNEVTVKSTPVKVVKLQNNKVTVKVNSKVQLGASITPINATDKTLKWVSNNENIATVDAFGNVTGVSNGVAEIKVFAQNGIYDTCTVTVEDNIEIPRASIFYEAIKINGKMYGYHHYTGESRIFPYLTGFKEISINGEKELFVPSVIDVRQYSEDTFGTQSGLFNLLQILVESYTIVPSKNPFLEGNIQLMYASGNWTTTNKDLTSSSLKLGYEKKYESLNNVSIDQWYEYNGKQFRNPVISFEQNVRPFETSAKYFEQNGIRFVHSGSWDNELYVSINDLLQYLGINNSISYGKQGDSIYVEIK